MSIQHHAGDPIVLRSDSPQGRFAVVFEDDGNTGYLYGLDTDLPPDEPILDALHLYNVRSMAGTSIVDLEIRWDDGANRAGNRAGLFLGRRCSAVFDFDARRAVCRTGYPPANGHFTDTHEWDDAVAADL